MTADDKLAAFFADTAPPARDLVFQAEVAERVARRRALATVAALVPWTFVAIIVGWAVGPVMEAALVGMSGTLGPTLVLLGLTALGAVMLKGVARRLALA